jgi:hypothetical protein
MKKSKTAAVRRSSGPAKAHRRILDAQKNLRRIQAELEPYTKNRKVEEVSTAGKWCETSTLISDLCEPHRSGEQEAQN